MPAGSARHRSAQRRRAKVFWSGTSQAVRLPQEFRVRTAEVTIHETGGCWRAA